MDIRTLKTRNIINYFARDKKPLKGLLAFEWAVMAYWAFTLLLTLFAYTKLPNAQAMISERLHILAITVAMWAVYRIHPCRFTILCRVVVQMALLARWYPDTYEFNRVLPNLDHVFAATEQWMFGFQPALVFAAQMPSVVVSELMDMGYSMYYPMIAAVCFFYFFQCYKDFSRCAFIIMAAFFIYYVVFIFVPVAGPTFYYKAVGIDQIARGVFPAVGDYFNFHQDCLPSPGCTDGLFYHLVESAKAAGERPTAAFPSSHVGMSTICMMLAWRSGSKKLFWILMPIFVFLCFSTVYIQAHYAIDAIAGLLSGLLIYFALLYASRHFKPLK